jgi:hypothetical protein
MFPGRYFPRSYYAPRYFPQFTGVLFRICDLGVRVTTGSINVVARTAYKLNVMIRCH